VVVVRLVVVASEREAHRSIGVERHVHLFVGDEDEGSKQASEGLMKGLMKVVCWVKHEKRSHAEACLLVIPTKLLHMVHT